MDTKLNTLEKIIFFVILINAAFLIFYQLGKADSYTDGSHYSVRALGYFDYLVPYYQTAPIQWYEKIPWWSRLSFHDAPPVVFIIQHIFFKTFGENIIAMRLPSALAGLGTLLFLFLIAKKIYGKYIALLSMAILSFLTFFVWISRIPYLEGVEIFFITFTLYVFFCALEKNTYFIWFGIVLGITFLTKYTSGFLFIFIILYLLLKQRKFFFNKNFIFGMVLCLIILSPVIYYNIEVFITRGHFDVQISHLFPSMFSAAQKDWPILYTEPPGPWNILKNFNSTWAGIKGGFSLPLYYFILISLLYIFVQAFFFIKEKNRMAIPLALFSAMVMFLIIPPNTRYLPILLPFIAISLGVIIYDILFVFSKKLPVVIIWAGFILLFGFEYIYSFTTNHLAPYTNEKSFFYANYAEKNLGYNQLEEFLKTTWVNETFYTKEIKKNREFNDIKLVWQDLKNFNFYLFDFNLNWFARIWYFNGQWIYHGVPFMGDTELVQQLEKEKIPLEEKFTVLRILGIKNLYYIVGKIDDVYSGDLHKSKERRGFVESIEDDFLQYMKKTKDGEVTPIYNLDYREAFRVYRIKLN